MTRSSTISTNVLVLLLSALMILIAPGCDALDDAVNDAIPDVDVPLGSAGNTIPVAPGSAVKTSAIDGEEDLPSGFDVTNIILEEDQVTYQPITGKASRAASGTIFAAILIDRVPAISTTITITDDVVTDISPDEISIGSYDATALAAAIEGLDTDDATDLLRDNYGNYSAGEIRDIVRDALGSDSFQLSVLIDTDDDLGGTLDIDRITIDIEV